MTPSQRHAPRSPAEVAALLREAAAQRMPLVARGGGTHFAAQPAVPANAALLELRGLSQVLAYDPGDLTLVVEAGCTIAEIERVLAANEHELALDAEEPERATIGGLLAADFPTRAGAAGRALRDQVLGTRVAQVDGTLTRSGGRVVKNVTGYDLEKLFVGSRGTLAVLVEVALRVHPRPPARACVAAACASFEAAHALCLRWRDPQPAQLDALDVAAARAALGELPAELADARWIALASWRGSERVVAAHAERASAAARDLGARAQRVEGELAARALAFDRAPRRSLGAGSGGLVLALAGRPSQAPVVERALVEALRRSGNAAHARLHAEAAGTRLRACFAEAPSRESFAALLDALASVALTTEARVHLESAPGALHEELLSARLCALRPPCGGLAAMRRVRAAFDPIGVLGLGAWPELDAAETHATATSPHELRA
jgi:FAD/FMN-containing dehydrogenase